MDLDIPFTSLAPPVFNGNNYHVWDARMEAHLEANDLWEAVKEEYVVPELQDNPILAQMKKHKEKKTRKSKARATLFVAVSSEIFIRIITIKSAFKVWNFLKEEYKGNEKISGIQVLNLIRKFEMVKMKDSETIKEYSNRLLTIVNNVRLLGTKFPDSRLVQEVLIIVLKRFEATISSLENTTDLSKVSLAEILSAFQAQE
ncbi:uncharacterized protein LOC124941566 [Impatiens glandulifera]|uniref:uncharacterized protein LOC124941566 n=1 Tax=Impatiens glandulifera TaxID=253017 RepID=UPI001FB0B10B|nr:uncharacterized protein LOC124941566 [Impatiens glandulifera]